MKQEMSFLHDETAQLGRGIIGALLAIILTVAVAIPVATDVIKNVKANVTGTTGTILDLVPLMLAVGVLVVVLAVAGLMRA